MGVRDTAPDTQVLGSQRIPILLGLHLEDTMMIIEEELIPVIQKTMRDRAPPLLQGMMIEGIQVQSVSHNQCQLPYQILIQFRLRWAGSAATSSTTSADGAFYKALR
jgi:hypothetical protein